MRVDAIAPVVAAAPGERAVVRIRIVNDGPSPATYHARVLGVDGQLPMAIDGGPVPPGVTAEVDLSIAIPRTYAAGRHAVAIEVASDRPGEPPALAGLTLAVDSLDRVLLRVEPTTIRGRRRGKFRVELDNRGAETVDLTLHGEGHHLAVRVRPPRFTLRAGERARAKGTVKGPRRVFGETDHHIVAIVARGRSAPRQTTAAFLQRPLVPRPARVALAALLALALWASAVGAVALWWTNRDDTTEQATEQAEASAQGAEGAEGGAGAEGAETGTGAAEGTGGAGAEGAAAGAEGAEEAGAGRPTHTLIGGTVRAGESGDDGEVTVSLAPVDLGAPPPEGAVVANPGESVPTKLWPARYGRYAPPGITAGRQTVSVETATTGDDGVWQFGAIPIRQTYEVHLAKEGYDSQSFVVTPTDDGKPVDLEVVLEPASGAVGGRVFGPGGPRGGVEIVVTDGTLRFTATTSTAPGSTGTWTIGGVSTPGEYTVTASASGLGTEVIQVGLEPGEQRTDLRITMAAGVGSIGGHVNFAGNPLSGVTVEATNGELTRTTSSLTDGDPGSYFFPKVAIPAEWTVTVSGDGFVTQTRRVSLDGNASRVDFDLVRTTASVTGVVVSDVRGPLAGASITIARDKLSFRTVSAVAPDTGSFSVGDLPPGTYLVSFGRFDHRAASQLVTLSAGEVKDLGQVVLAFEERPPIAETGRLVVRVLDGVGTELTGASVTVTDVADGTMVAQASDPDQNQSTFAFDNVPIGTYEVRVTRPQYRTATSRVSIGLGEEVVEFRLLKLGQVSGRLVDSLSGEQLDNYEITIYRVNGPGDEEEIQRRTVLDGAEPNEEGEILWESEESSLTTGTYRVRVSDAPPGFLVVEDQVLDPSIPEGQPRTMLFEIRPENDDPLRLADIEADRFPSLSGRIYVPGPRDPPLDAGCAGPLCPIDSAMTVTLTCPGSQAGAVPAVLSDEIGDTGTSAFDTYRFSPILLDQNGLLGPCVIDVTSGGYVAASINLATPLAASDGDTASDQVVNIALVAEIDAIGGSLNWLDLGVTSGQERPVDAAQISTAAAVTGFAEAQGTDPNAVPQPIVEALSTQSVDGVWQLAGQVFGEATYVFSHTQFDEGTAAPELTIDIAPDGTRTVSPTPPASGPLVAVDAGAANILVTLQEPDRAEISGSVNVLTTDLPPECAAVGVSATEPGAAPTDLPLTVAGSACTFATGPSQPGTWDFAFTPPDHHVFYPGAPTSFVDRFVEPDSTVTGIDTTLVELARIDVQVLDTNMDPIEVAGVRPEVSIALVPLVAGDPTFAPRTQTVDAANGETIFDDLPVNLVDPLDVTLATTYQLSVEMPGFDTSDPSARPTRALRAGENPIVVIILLPEFGTLAGSVDGQVGAATEDIPHDPPLAVTAVRRAMLDGTPTPGETPITAADDPNPANPGGFLLSGPPGWYTVTAVHPHFQPTPACPAQPPLPPPPPPPPVLPPGLPVCTYPIINDTDLVLAPIVLAIEPGTMTLSVVDDRGVAVPNVSVNVDGVLQGVTGSDGTLVVGNLIPGAVALDLRRLDTNGEDDHFPVIATVTVPRGATPAERDVAVTATMPRIGASITGTVVARNTEGDLFLLPQITLSREYAFPAPPPGVTPVPNAADETDLVAPPLTEVVVGPGLDPPAALPFEFPGLAVGVHTITASPVAGYTTPAIGAVPITSPTPTALGTLAYVANPVDVVVAVTSSAGGQALVDATVTLTPPGGGPALVPVEAPPGTFTFDAVTPDPLDYTVNVSAPLFTGVSEAVEVRPDPDGTIAHPVALVPEFAAISGVAQKQETQTGTPVGLVGEGTVRLFLLDLPADPVGVEVASTTPGTGGAYEFDDITAAGDYRIQVELADHATRDTTLTGVLLGQAYTATTVVVPALATAEITVTGDATTASDLQVVVTTPPASGLVAVRQGNIFVFDALDPETPYQFQVRATGFVSVNVPTSQALDPDVGGLHIFSAQPQHLLLVTVTTEDSSGDETRATVQIRMPAGGTVVATQTGTGASNVYSFVGLAQGAGDVVVTRNGYRTRVVTFTDAHTAINIPVVLSTLVTASGTVTDGTAAVPNVTVSATRGSTTLTDVTDGVGGYSIAGLDSGSWTISALVPGTGADSESLTITGQSPSAVTVDLVLVPRDFAFEFTVTSATNASPVAGASVTLDGESDDTDANGEVTLTVPEDGALAWSVTHDDYVTQTGTATLSDLTVAVALVPRPLAGTVLASGGAPSVGTPVFVCPVAAALCDSATDIATDTSDATGEFSVTLSPGTYEVRAVGTTSSPETTVVVSAAGVAAPNDITLTLAA